MMRTLIKVLFSTILASSTIGVASAALITVDDREKFDFDPANNYEFIGTIGTGSTLDTDNIVSYGVNVDLDEDFYFTVTAPNEFDLTAELTTKADFGGTILAAPNFLSLVYAGTSVTFQIDGDFHSGETAWLSVYAPIETLEQHGPLEIGGGTLQETAPVPVPPAVWLFGSGLVGLVGIARRRSTTAT